MSEAVIEKGKDLIIREDYDEALKYFKELSKNDKDNPLYTNYIGIIYFLKEDFKNAADIFKQAIELDPNNWYPYQKLGQICTIKNIDSCAIKYFTETIERNPTNIYSLLNLAVIFQREQVDITLELVSSALKIDPLNPAANYLMATLCLNKKDYKTSEQLFRNVIEKDPRNAIAWYKLGLTYFRCNKHKKGIEALTNALEINKKPYLYNLLGLIQMKKIKLQEAIDSFKEAIKLDPKDANFWINLADAYMKGNRIESSKLCLKEALKVAEKDYQKLIIWIHFANCYERENFLPYSLYCLENASERGSEQINSKLEAFDEFESKMELIHNVNLRIDQLKKKGIIAEFPEEDLKDND
ncbi:MAG: tetratricopeptide repeat protein [Promethearchaeota archaeon]